MGSGDRYAYVGNNPTNNTDPSGHTRCDADGYCGDQANVGKKDDRVDPNDWGDPTGKDNVKRTKMSKQVWNLLCSMGWWGCNDPKKLAAWLLQHELGDDLTNQALYKYNLERGIDMEKAIRDSVTYLHYILASLEKTNPESMPTMPTRLAEMTSFFNPEQDGKFDDNDLKLLLQEPNDTAVSQVDRYWNSDYSIWQGKKLNWWMPSEGSGLGADYTIYNLNGSPKEYFQTVPY